MIAAPPMTTNDLLALPVIDEPAKVFTPLVASGQVLAVESDGGVWLAHYGDNKWVRVFAKTDAGQTYA